MRPYPLAESQYETLSARFVLRKRIKSVTTRIRPPNEENRDYRKKAPKQALEKPRIFAQKPKVLELEADVLVMSTETNPNCSGFASFLTGSSCWSYPRDKWDTTRLLLGRYDAIIRGEVRVLSIAFGEAEVSDHPVITEGEGARVWPNPIPTGYIRGAARVYSGNTQIAGPPKGTNA